MNKEQLINQAMEFVSKYPDQWAINIMQEEATKKFKVMIVCLGQLEVNDERTQFNKTICY